MMHIMWMRMITALLMVLPASVAFAQGPATEALRAKLPAPGVVLIADEDASAIEKAVPPDSRASVVDAGGQIPAEQAVRVDVTRAYPHGYDVQLFSRHTAGKMAKGDLVLVSCWARAPQAEADTQSLALIRLQLTREPWNAFAEAQFLLGREWVQIFTSGIADRDYAAGEMRIVLHLGQQKQVIDIAAPIAINLGKNVDPNTLPRTRLTWPGMAPDAPWRREAQRRIEAHRMGELRITIVDSDGTPVPDATVHVRQTRRAFGIGSFTGNPKLTRDDDPDGRQMRDIYKRLFNRATVPIYWADWGWPKAKDDYLALAKWFHDNGYATRGHVMIYPGWQFLPKEVVAMKNDPQKLRARILQQVREIAQATRPFGFREYDVTNELRHLTEVPELIGRDAVVDWFAEARRELPNAKLALNENSLLTGGGYTTSNQDNYLEWYRYLKSKGHAPDVMGFQAHFGESFTAPEKVWKILDRFAAETDAELQITEFDINTLDEAAQAAYTRDFLTACFAHERVTGFTMWGFWEGDHWQPPSAAWRKDWSPKPNARVLEELLTKTWWTDLTLTTPATGTASARVFLGQHRVTVSLDNRKAEANATVESPDGAHLRVTLK
jgi:endo-1,4-beta-xylanase